MKRPVCLCTAVRASGRAGVPELDVTPVMNMFIILIPFLVSMAAFTHLSIIKFTLPPNAGAGLDRSQGMPKPKMTVVVADTYLALTLGDQLLDSIPSTGGTGDYSLLGARLSAYRSELETADDAVVAVRDNIAMKHVVAVMDRVREAGFEKIGLSNATGDPVHGI